MPRLRPDPDYGYSPDEIAELAGLRARWKSAHDGPPIPAYDLAVKAAALLPELEDPLASMRRLFVLVSDAEEALADLPATLARGIA